MSKAHIIFGPIGAGKSTFAQELSHNKQAVRFSTDEWFSTLFFADISGTPPLAWYLERISRCETQILHTAMQLVSNDLAVVLDMGLAKLEDRNRIASFFDEQDLKQQLYYLTAPVEVRKKRVNERNSQRDNTGYYVSPEIFEFTDSLFETPTAEELERVTTIQTG